MRRKTLIDSDIRNVVARIIKELVSNDSLDDDTNIFEAGLINSLVALQIVNTLENTFAFEVGEADLERENFASIKNITRFVIRKKAEMCAATP